MKFKKSTDPTPNQIAARSREIRDAWSEKTEWSRAGKPKQTWTAPVAQLGELAASVEEFVVDHREDVLR